MGFSLLILFLCDKNSCTVLNTAFEIFSVVTKNRCHLCRHTSQKTQKYFYNGKNIKKNFLQLRCSDVVLHLKYEVLFCELKIKCKKVVGGKALATNHRALNRKEIIRCSSQSPLVLFTCESLPIIFYSEPIVVQEITVGLFKICEIRILPFLT